MRRFRNPRFAPESLERKLSPSGVAPVPVAAVVYVPSDTTTSTSDDGGDPPVSTPGNPSGPILPG
jgi:hypothetical protein